tara:strand:+ start:991 stop:1683 length:693 start_codon:yes stop_codon:yes gene_type:complete
MEDLNKITSTRVGDNIHFFVNGKEDSGTVVKMNTSFVTVVKDNGVFQDIHINDTFFIKDILVNKTWNDMNMEERTVALHEIHAYSPRFLAKSWQQLPKELKDVMLEKSNVEQGAYGTIGGQPAAGIETNQKDDAEDEYEGQTEDDKKEQFKHEELKPTTKSMQEEIWEQWLDKGEGMGEGSAPAQTSMTTGTTGVYNAVYGKDGRIIGQGEDKDEEEEDKKEDKKEEKKE